MTRSSIRKKRRKLRPQTEASGSQTKRRFHKLVSLVFEKAGFRQVANVNGKEIKYLGRSGEFDAIFSLENILLIVEETCSENTETLHGHLRKKSEFYNHIAADRKFVQWLFDTYPDLKSEGTNNWHLTDFKVIHVYCSMVTLEHEYRNRYPDIIFFDELMLRYFRQLGLTIGISMLYELFKCFGLNATDTQTSAEIQNIYDGFILPESPSGFPSEYRIVTFYIDPGTLIKLSYVLRKDGWVSGDHLYQRMISRSKIRSMRQYLASEKRVFINNIIVSLASSTQVRHLNGKDVDPNAINKVEKVKIIIDNAFNSIGLIDGQHRVFAYHEGTDSYEKSIKPQRGKRQLLVTGVLYPPGVPEIQQRGFEAGLFLEINDKQTKTRADLRHAIQAIVNPFSVIAIGRSVISRLATSGPLAGYIERHQFDTGKIKSSSIVTYGLRHIVKCEGEDSLFKLWSEPNKDLLAKAVQLDSKSEKNEDAERLLNEYIKFCVAEIRNILIGYESFVPKEMWTLKRSVSAALSTTAINGVIFCLRNLIQSNKTMDIVGYKKAFSSCKLNFAPKEFKYKSSHWNALGARLAKDCFGVSSFS